MERRFLLVDVSVLPEVFLKVVKAKAVSYTHLAPSRDGQCYARDKARFLGKKERHGGHHVLHTGVALHGFGFRAGLYDQVAGVGQEFRFHHAGHRCV